MREATERPEAVEAGTVKLVGTSRKNIFIGVEEVQNTDVYTAMSHAHNPYGDGHAVSRIMSILEGLAFQLS